MILIPIIIIIGIFAVYIILLVFVLAVIYTKVKRKEKIEPVWWWIFFGLLAIPILYLFTVGYMSPTPLETIETINIETGK
jgi:4-amino-4-deoxy-L-arabinose transferase-like glycosyltransferase